MSTSSASRVPSPGVVGGVGVGGELVLATEGGGRVGGVAVGGVSAVVGGAVYDDASGHAARAASIASPAHEVLPSSGMTSSKKKMKKKNTSTTTTTTENETDNNRGGGGSGSVGGGDSTAAAVDTVSMDSAVSYQWLDEGIMGNDGNRYHSSVQLTCLGRAFEVRVGDAVFVWSDRDDDATKDRPPLTAGAATDTATDAATEEAMAEAAETTWKAQWPCRVEKMWESFPTGGGAGAGAGEADADSAADEDRVHFQGRWFFRRSEIANLPGSWNGPLSRSDLVEEMDEASLVLSNTVDGNDISSIQGPCAVRYVTDADAKGGASAGSASSRPVYTCRYSLDIDPERPFITVSRYTESDFRSERAPGDAESITAGSDNKPTAAGGFGSSSKLAPTAAAMATTAAPGTTATNNNKIVPQQRGNEGNDAAESLSSEGGVDDEEEEEEEEDSDASSLKKVLVAVPEGEGTNLREDIEVGARHQATVGPYVPGRTVTSRNPKLIWKPNSISGDRLQSYLERLASAHTPYLKRNHLTMTDPYSPLPPEECEDMMSLTPGEKLSTGSTLSTASMLGTDRTGFLKECDADAVLELLHRHDYDAESALDEAVGGGGGNAQGAVSTFLSRDMSTGWTNSEKAIFDDSFRRFQGSLRDIARALSPTKSTKEVIDYYYRFKIPDQYRRYQNKKREQAIRIVECIEKRRYHDPSLYVSVASSSSSSEAVPASDAGGNAKDKGLRRDAPPLARAHKRARQHWSETSTSEVTGAVAERRRAAKELLLDVQTIMGQDTMVEVAAAVRRLHLSYDDSTRNELLNQLDGQPELQRRFLDFLPKHI